MGLNPDLLEILACPETKKPLIYFEEEGFFFCVESKLKYAVVDDVPNFLIDEATRVDEKEAARLVDEAKKRGLKNAPAE